jgi:hypothetical protein
MITNHLRNSAMLPSYLHAIDPLARFQELYHALGAETAWWSVNSWLRFAAQAAVMRPASPAETARAIHASAEELSRQARWYEPLASSLNLVVAATMVQTGDTAQAFVGEVHDAHQLLGKAGFHHGGTDRILSILAMRVLSGNKPATAAAADRMHRIYVQMRKHHWWLTGGEDVTSCALLATRSGTPEEIAGVADGVYRLLVDAGFKAGNHLQTAANLLPLTGLDATAASRRFIDLVAAFKATHSIWREDYDAYALLSLLDHEPERIVAKFSAAFDQLKKLEPDLYEDVDAAVAADLVFLDLARFDRKMRLLSEPAEIERMHDLIRIQRAASLALIDVPPTPVVPDGIGLRATT